MTVPSSNTTEPRHVGIAGCGAMGLPMARSLASAGFNVSGFDVRPANDFGDFSGSMIASPDVFSQTSDILISVVRDEKQTRDLFFDDQALYRRTDYPKTCLLASTVSVGFIHAVRAALPDDVVLIDAPMSGAPIAAEEARLTFMVGAADTSAAPIAPLLNAMGREIHYLGGLGKGMACKVLNNFVAASSIAAVRQVLSHAQELGVSSNALLQVMRGSSGATWYGDNIELISWAAETYSADNTIGIVEKDVNSLLASLPSLEVGSPARVYMEGIRNRLSSLPPFPKNKL